MDPVRLRGLRYFVSLVVAAGLLIAAAGSVGGWRLENKVLAQIAVWSLVLSLPSVWMAVTGVPFDRAEQLWNESDGCLQRIVTYGIVGFLLIGIPVLLVYCS